MESTVTVLPPASIETSNNLLDVAYWPITTGRLFRADRR